MKLASAGSVPSLAPAVVSGVVDCAADFAKLFAQAVSPETVAPRQGLEKSPTQDEREPRPHAAPQSGVNAPAQIGDAVPSSAPSQVVISAVLDVDGNFPDASVGSLSAVSAIDGAEELDAHLPKVVASQQSLQPKTVGNQRDHIGKIARKTEQLQPSSTGTESGLADTDVPAQGAALAAEGSALPNATRAVLPLITVDAVISAPHANLIALNPLHQLSEPGIAVEPASLPKPTDEKLRRVIATSDFSQDFFKVDSSDVTALETPQPVLPAVNVADVARQTVGPTERVDRSPTFSAHIAVAIREVMSFARDRDLQFTLRPEMLGQIDVTIERSEAGQTLRLGVETPAAVQTVRAAEPILNDVRGGAPFVQISVDLNAPDSRGRPVRAPIVVRRLREDALSAQITHTASGGRYA